MKLSAKQIPVLATAAVFILLYAIASFAYKGFFSTGVFVNFFGDNAVLGIAAIGMTFVILSGGIDLSVGAVIGFTGILVALLIQEHDWPPLLAITFALLAGTILGAGMGCLIYFLVYQQIENHVIQPAVIGRAVEMSPAATMLTALVGGSALGLPGALISVPLIGAAKSVTRQLAGQQAPARPSVTERRAGRWARLRRRST